MSLSHSLTALLEPQIDDCVTGVDPVDARVSVLQWHMRGQILFLFFLLILVLLLILHLRRLPHFHPFTSCQLRGFERLKGNHHNNHEEAFYDDEEAGAGAG